MTNIADCLQRAIDFGEMDRQRGIAYQSEFAQLVARYETIMPAATARVQATKDLKEASKAKVARRKHYVLNQLRAEKRIMAEVLRARDPAAAIRNLLEYSEGSGYRGESVRSLTEAYTASIHAGIAEVLNKTGLDVLGRSRDGQMLLDMIRELHNEASGNAKAKVLADAVRKQQQRMRRSFNAHGGDVGDLADYGVPHSHDPAAMMKAGFDQWAADILPRLAWDRIPDFTTGKPFAAAPGRVPSMAEARDFLEDVFNGITTKGWNDRDPTMSLGGRALANQRQEHRVLHFASGSDWIEYNRAYGTGDPFSAMMGGLHGLARDVALLRVLGPNPRMGLAFAEQVVKRRAAQIGGEAGAKLAERAERQGKLARTMLAHQDGSANIPDHVGWARFMGGTRAVLTSAQLGSAVLSSVTDAATITMAAQTVGMNANNVLSRSVKLMAKEMDRADAARAGYVAETLADTMAGSTRFFGQAVSGGIPDRLASFTLRASGLNFVTDMRKLAFQMEMGAHMASQAGRAFDALDAPLRKMMADRGITARDWDLLRDPAVRFQARDGADFITPIYWLEHQTALPRAEAEGLAMRLQMAIREQLEYAIPTATLEGRARLQGSAPPGSIAGEFLRSAMMYKSFALSLTLGQYRRIAEAGSWGRSPWVYAAKISALLAVTGALAIQLKELAKGNDPRPMNQSSFWLASTLQGGGLGIFGDFFNATQNRVGGGFASTLAGPVVAAASDVGFATMGNLAKAIKGDETTVGRDVAGLVRKYTPVASSIWYGRTAYSRLVADELTMLLDPEAEIQMRRRLKKQQREYGTQPFIPMRGSDTGFRLPDFSNALGGQE